MRKMKVSLLLAPGQGTIHHDSGHTWAHDSNYAVSGIIKLDGGNYEQKSDKIWSSGS